MTPTDPEAPALAPETLAPETLTPETLTPEDQAMAVVELARTGQFDQIRELFTAGLRPMVTAAGLQAAWEAELAERGQLTAVGSPTSDPADGAMTTVMVPVRFERGEQTIAVYLTRDGQLAGIQLAPPVDPQAAAPWEPPGYADPAAFDEQEVTLGAGPLAVPGTLSLPRRPGPLPAVVLLGGSGPEDRDGSIGRSRPLKDLAWGLASRGIAVLRFDKVTHAHPDQVSGNRAFTVADEYLPDARAAIGLLQSHPAIDPARVFMAGHSLGGTVAPRVAAAEPSVAGLILLAGGVQPLQWAAVRQISYLASLAPASAAAAQPGIDALTAQALLVDSPDLSPDTPDAELPFGVPAPYWLDLRRYDPVAVAASLGKPMLILQGGRDYQATVADDLSRWRAGLDQRPDVVIRVYPADNHFFFPGAGPSSPAELAARQHLDPEVVVDIGDWLGLAR
ncbi:MAG TPA: alpha/beta hydrolase [Trebonia sp.]|nr:alpha/beta hydrolase [Trebonia sp.]